MLCMFVFVGSLIVGTVVAEENERDNPAADDGDADDDDDDDDGDAGGARGGGSSGRLKDYDHHLHHDSGCRRGQWLRVHYHFSVFLSCSV